MTPGLEAAGHVHRQVPIYGGQTRLQGLPALPPGEEAHVLRVDYLQDGERIVELGEVHGLGSDASVVIGLPGRPLGRPKTLSPPVGQGDAVRTVANACHLNFGPLRCDHPRCCPVRYGGAIEDPKGIGHDRTFEDTFDVHGLLEVGKGIASSIGVGLHRHHREGLPGLDVVLHI